LEYGWLRQPRLTAALLKENDMKNTMKVFGIIALVAVIGFALTACEPEPEGIETYEATTNGRLTITGLSAYNGKFINAYSYASSVAINAVERATNEYLPNGGYSSVKLIYASGISGGQAVLKVFVDKGEQSGKGGGFQSYTGNDTVNFDVYIRENDDLNSNAAIIANGSVTVNFANGIASGAFVPD
jgi:hypothetical protein